MSSTEQMLAGQESILLVKFEWEDKEPGQIPRRSFHGIACLVFLKEIAASLNPGALESYLESGYISGYISLQFIVSYCLS